MAGLEADGPFFILATSGSYGLGSVGRGDILTALKIKIILFNIGIRLKWVKGILNKMI